MFQVENENKIQSWSCLRSQQAVEQVLQDLTQATSQKYVPDGCRKSEGAPSKNIHRHIIKLVLFPTLPFFFGDHLG